MNLIIQDPVITPLSLHEVILSKLEKAVDAGGIFAFATAEGVNLLFKDNVSTEYFKNNKFQLIVGTDDITNLKAYYALQNISTKNSNLNVKFYIHKSTGNLFHPKYCWFKNKDNTGSLIIGSGNLTLGGLRNNIEACTVIEMDEEQTKTIIGTINTWISNSSQYLFDLNDQITETVATKNTAQATLQHQLKQTIKNTKLSSDQMKELQDLYKKQNLNKNPIKKTDNTKQASHDNSPSDTNEYDENYNFSDDAWLFKDTSTMLVAEVPKASGRWSQINLNHKTYTEYFGLGLDENSVHRRIILKNVTSQGLGDIESRPGVAVKSKNYRIEIDAAQQLAYPKKGVPLLVFAKINPSSFLYELIMPKNPCYTKLNNIIKRERKKQDPKIQERNFKIRYQITATKLQKRIPNLEIWKYMTTEQ